MRFERGKGVKEALNIGIPTYSIYRMQVFRAKKDEMGFYILTPAETKETLEKLSKGEFDRPKYEVEFAASYPELENKVSMSLYELKTCFLRYHTKDYFIKSHIV